MPELSGQIEKYLCAGLVAQKISFNEQKIIQLRNYLELLSKWNNTHNLTAITNFKRMVDLHVLDSLSVLSEIKGPNLLDVGSGGGLPGLIVAIFKPDLQVTSIDARGKKIQFQQFAAATLGLNNFQAIHSRVEQYQTQKLFAQIISRAFSSLDNFIGLTEHLLQADGQWLAMKGQLPEDEMLELFKKRAMQPSLVKSLSVPNVDAERHLLIFKPTV